jgi:hypothetical protein
VQAETMFWRRLDRPGHEAARLVFHAPFWQLTGTAVFGGSGAPCRIEYQVTCDAGWHTLAAQVTGWIGERRILCAIAADGRRRWRLDGHECAEVEGCVDLDLAFSPATNLLPIRRLGLAVGESAPARAAWLSFPELRLTPLEQRYHRLDGERYRYEAGPPGDLFRVELRVAPSGMVLEYPARWVRESDR